MSDTTDVRGDTVREQLLEGIYEAAGDDSKWLSSLGNLASWMRSFAGLYYLVDKTVPGGKVRSMHLSGYSAGDLLAYAGYYNAIDPHAPLVARTPVQTWFLSQEHFDDAFVQRDPFFQEFLLPRRARWVIGTRLWETQDAVAMFAFDRFADAPPFDVDDQHRIGSMTSHLSRAARLHLRLMTSEFEARLGVAAIHLLNFGMAMVSDDGLVLLSNRVAEDHFRKPDVFRSGAGNRLVLQNPACNARFAQALTEATQLRSAALTVLDRHGRPALHAMVMPLPAAAALNDSWQRPLAMLILTELNTPREVPQHYLKQLFSLTASEAQLANGLMTGQTVEDFRFAAASASRRYASTSARCSRRPARADKPSSWPCSAACRMWPDRARPGPTHRDCWREKRQWETRAGTMNGLLASWRWGAKPLSSRIDGQISSARSVRR